MTAIDPQVQAALAAHEAGRYDETLALLQQLFERAQMEHEAAGSPYFMATFGMQLLLPVYPPAHAVVQAWRDEQVRLLQAGDLYFGPPLSDDLPMRKERFSVIVQLNELLADPQSTCALYAGFDRSDPALARKYAYRALPAVVEVGDWALADRYRGDPLHMLAECNALRHSFPLFPPARVAPRLAATMMSLLREVHIGMAVLRGLGDAAAALALRAALLEGLEDAPMRQLAEEDLAAPGAIGRALSAHQMTLDDRAPPTDT